MPAIELVFSHFNGERTQTFGGLSLNEKCLCPDLITASVQKVRITGQHSIMNL